MTLEEAIIRCEKVAEIHEKEFRLCPYPSDYCNGSKDCKCQKNGVDKGCLKYAKEHRQFASWLKELKVIHYEIDDMSDYDEIFIGYLRKKMKEVT